MRKTLSPARWTQDLGQRWAEVVGGCGNANCSGAKSLWYRVRRHRNGILMQGVTYCRLECLEHVLAAKFRELQSLPPEPRRSNRIPLGLLMVARGKLTYTEVLAALEAQRRARYGMIGEWIEKLGFATEQEVTAALALQWGCPVVSTLRTEIIEPPRQVPLPLLETFRMWPLHYASSTNTLYFAFGERVDHAALYTIEQMLDCRTQPCVAGRKSILTQLERLRRQPRLNEVLFGRMQDPAEMARIAGSYLRKLGAEEVRLRRLGAFLWLRVRTRINPVDVLFRLRSEPHRARVPIPSILPLPLSRQQGYADAGIAE